jgi:exodeoxyribonuclease V alpha subunit
MIDLYLMERILAALPSTAQLVLLGDANQLPSVSAGAVFRDLLDLDMKVHNDLPAHFKMKAQLTQSYRMRADNPAGRAILNVARDLSNGKDLWDRQNQTIIHQDIQSKITPADLTFHGVEHLDLPSNEYWQFYDYWSQHLIYGDEEIQKLRKRTWRFEGGRIHEDEQTDLTRLFEYLSKGRVLCLTQNLDTGVSKVNARFHARYAQHMGFDFPFLVGEPVMMLHNDYDRLLFNGDQGLILWTQHGNQRQPMVIFPELGGSYKGYEIDALAGRIEHCYAMTVHKSQGSEFDQIALILPPYPIPLLSKELMYTAITRSRHAVTFVGNGSLLSATHLESAPRSSGLKTQIQKIL